MTETDHVYDLVIVGAGPAGLTAAIYASRALLDYVIVEQGAPGGQIVLTDSIENYPGVGELSGAALAQQMTDQATSLGATFVYDAAEELSRSVDGTFELRCTDATYRSRSVIVTTGVTPRHAGFEGEETFGGHGVSYCATCDGMFYMGKDVFVVGGGNTACEEALFLTRFARHVTLVVRRDVLRADAIVKQRLEENEKIEVRYNTSIVSLEGEALPSAITLKDNPSGNISREDHEEGTFGVFVFTGQNPANTLIKDLVEIDSAGYAVANERMESCTPGLFCAGDLREKPLRQVITAASDGAIAASSAASYVASITETH